MLDWALLRIMILKEFRVTFRERAQLRGLVVSVVVMVLAISGSFSNSRRAAMVRGAVAMSQPAVMTPQEQSAERWIAIGGGAFAGFFFSMGYLISATLSSFVGEKEGRTLEVLLASPLSNRQLFFFKGVSVLLPSAAVGCLFAGILATVLIGVLHVADPPAAVIGLAIVCAPPLMMLVQLWFVGLGAAISVRAETLKGAAQGLSVVFLVLMFGGGYGIPMLLRNFPDLQAQVSTFVGNWLRMPFGKQYLGVALVLGVVSSICIRIGRASFRRDRMLT